MTTAINEYMKRQGFGDYSRADDETRERMERGALEYAAQEQGRKTIFADLGARAQMERYEDGTATAQDVIALRGSDAITAEDATRYYEARGWALPKFGIR